VSGDHHHAGAARAGARYRGRLTVILVMVVTFMIVQVIAGLLTGSLALLSDAGHMATDALGLGMALAAIIAADRAGTHRGRTYGLYRSEILAALANAVLLFAVAIYVLWEAAQRVREPEPVSVAPMLVVATLGLVVNVVSWWMLREGAEESVNVEGAMLEVLADMLGSIGVVIAGVVIAFTGWTVVDAIVGAGIGLFILPRAWRLGRKAVRILIEAAPEDLDLDRLRRDLEGIEGVTDIHDLHVWTLTSGMPVATVHLITSAEGRGVLTAAQQVLSDDYGIAHATLQVEAHGRDSCRELSW
jgi:cobalt-zinc-cadmium efflux system protein